LAGGSKSLEVTLLIFVLFKDILLFNLYLSLAKLMFILGSYESSIEDLLALVETNSFFRSSNCKFARDYSMSAKNFVFLSGTVYYFCVFFSGFVFYPILLEIGDLFVFSFSSSLINFPKIDDCDKSAPF